MLKAFLMTSLFSMSLFANEIVLQPGSSVYVKPSQPMKVSCEGNASNVTTMCQCNSYHELLLVYVDGTGAILNKLMLQAYEKRTECFDAKRTNPRCN